MENLIESFGKSLFIDSKDIIENYLEIGMDELIGNDFAKEIPIIDSITTMFKIGRNLYNRNLLKQTLIFLNEFNNNTLPQDKIIAYKSTINNNPKFCEKEIERVLILLNRIIDEEKAKILAKLYKEYIKKEINWSEFCEMTEINDRLFVSDLKILKEIYLKKVEFTSNEEIRMRADRLNSYGLVEKSYNSSFAFEVQQIRDSYLNVSDLGKMFCKIIFTS